MEFIALIGVLAFAVIIEPFIVFWLSYFGGWVASFVIGNPLCQALNILFQTDMFKPEILPWIAGALGWIGSYFKSTYTNSNK